MGYTNRLFLLCFIGLVSVVYAGEGFPEENHVLVLNEENFDAAIKHFDTLLVEFYAPWCGHCKRLEPEYASAATTLRQNNPPIYIAKVDATENEALSEKYEVRGYPTVKLFKSGHVVEYDGGRKAEEIVDYMKAKSDPITTELTSVNAAKKFANENEIIVVGLFNHAQNFFETFQDLAFSFTDEKFAFTTNPTVKAHFGHVDDTETIVIIKKNKEKLTLDLKESTTKETIAEFISESTTPLVLEFTPKNVKKIFDGPIKTYTFVFVDENANYLNDLLNDVQDIAQEFKGKLLHVLVPSSEFRILEFFGINLEDLPTVSIADMRTESIQKYLYSQKWNKEHIRQFESNFLDGKLKAHKKSAKPSEDDDEGKVKVIVGETFEEKVINNKKDVLLEFYAPWCGHCQALNPIFEEVGEKFQDVKDIIIAKIDVTANEIDHPMVKIHGFPTILFFPGNSKDTPIIYDRERNVDDFVAFLTEHATYEFVVDGVKGGVNKHEEL